MCTALSLSYPKLAKAEMKIRELHKQLNKEFENIKLLYAMNEFDKQMSDNQQFQCLRVYMPNGRTSFSIYSCNSSQRRICVDITSMDGLKYRILLPVYIADMKHINDTPFTAIGVDHAGEQINKIMKIDGGLTGILNNEKCSHSPFPHCSPSC